MGVVDDTARPAGGLLADAVVEEMAGELAGGAAALLQAPDNAPGIPGLVNLHNADVVLGGQGHVAEILAAAGGNEKFSPQVVRLDAHVHPLAGGIFEIGAALLHFLGAHAVGEVAAVALVPALVPAVAAHADVMVHHFNIGNCHCSLPFSNSSRVPVRGFSG